MKTTALRNWTAVCVSVLTATTAVRAWADEPAAKHEKSYTGTVISVDPKEHVMGVRGFFFSKKFNLGDTCTYTFVGKGEGALQDLRPGQKVMVGYQDAHGVLVADRIEQQAMRYEGTVKVIDPEKHAFTMHLRAGDKTFRIADDCRVVRKDDKSGTLADVQPGQRVTVVYEMPNGELTARQIVQTSTAFTGTVMAIDLTDRTVKAKATFGTKKFNLADECIIMVNGKPDAQLSDLKPGDKFVFNYDSVNGINVVNRIASVETPTAALSAKSSR